MPDKVAVLLDGGFVKKKLQQQLSRFPTAAEVVAVTTLGHGVRRELKAHADFIL